MLTELVTALEELLETKFADTERALASLIYDGYWYSHETQQGFRLQDFKESELNSILSTYAPNL